MDQHVILAAVVLIVVLFIFMWYVMKSNEISTSNYTGYMHNLTEDHQYVRNPSMYLTPANNTHRENYSNPLIDINDKLALGQSPRLGNNMHNW